MAEIKWDLQKALELREKGYRYYEIAKELKVSINSVCCYFHKHYGKLDKVVSTWRGSIELTQEQKEVIFGTLMGDGNLRYNDSNISIFGRMNHCKKQFEYIKYKQQLLYNLTSEVRPYITKTKEKEYNSYYFTFKSNMKLIFMYDLFYKNNVKHIPKDLSLLTPRAMAFWFMDDGSVANPSIKIATCSFTLEDLKRLQDYLYLEYKLETSIFKGNRLYFKSESARRFKLLVKPFIIPEMMYKFKYVKDLN